MNKSIVPSLFLLLSLAISFPANAGDVVDLGKISLTGKRLESPFSEFVSSGVSSTQTVTREEIVRSGAQSLPQVLNGTSGIIVSDLSGNGEEPAVDFRGYNEGQDLVFLLDGVRLNEPKSNNINFPLIPIGLIDRMEISRGGASSLYGEGAMGGVVNIAGFYPKEDGFHGSSGSRFGSFGAYGEDFNASIKQSGTGIYLAGDNYHARGFRANSSVEKQDFYLKMAKDLPDKGHLALTYLYGNADLDRSGSIRETLLESFGPKATERPRNFADLDSHLAIFDLSLIPLTDLALSGNFYFRNSSELSVANFATFDRSDNELDLDVNTLGFTLQADHSKELFWGLADDLLVGVDYADSAIREEDYNRSKATLTRLDQTVDSSSRKETAGIFSKLSVSWNERAGAYAGFRYDDIHFKNTDLINTDNNQPSAVSKVSQSAGVSYRFESPLTASAVYSHSFRSPSLADLYANPLFGGNPALKPEESSDHEIGLQWKDEKTTLKSDLFLNRRVNEIGFDPNLTDAAHLFGRNNNFGKTERMGSENFVESRIRPWLQVRASHTYTEAFFRSNTPDGTQMSGAHIPMVPRNRFTAGILIQPCNRWDVTVDMVSVCKQVLTNDLTNERNGRRLPAYTTFDLKTVYRAKRWEFFFQVSNLLNERYATGGSLGAAPSPFNTERTVEDNFFVPAPGRSFETGFRFEI